MNSENENNELLIKKVNEVNYEDLKSLITTKENQMKNILLQKISNLEKELLEKSKTIENMSESIKKLKLAYQSNLNLIEERDKDLKAYEEKFDSFTNIISIKDIEMKKLNENINELNNKLKYEKSQRNQIDEYNKFSQNKINIKHLEEINMLNKNSEELKKEIENLTNKIREYELNIKNNQSNFDIAKNYFKDKINSLIKEKEMNDLKLQISKLKILKQKKTLVLKIN